MNPALFEIGAAIFMAAAGVALVVWYSRYLAAASGRRMLRMLTSAGVDPGVARHGDAEAIMRDVRGRCERCRSEDLCDRWLAGKVEGGNSFCPNAQLFDMLTRTTGHTPGSPGIAVLPQSVQDAFFAKAKRQVSRVVANGKVVGETVSNIMLGKI